MRNEGSTVYNKHKIVPNDPLQHFFHIYFGGKHLGILVNHFLNFVLAASSFRAKRKIKLCLHCIKTSVISNASSMTVTSTMSTETPRELKKRNLFSGVLPTEFRKNAPYFPCM